ncbi:TPA: carbohydrate kinase family protein [Candidatus Woesearchaeota archaeon]|nr:carbohydrate kinase family protein [Candidatus Woesearchaeota archaeon]
MYDVIAIGSATIDVFLQTDKRYVRNNQIKGNHVEEYCFPVGTKLLVRNLEFSTGGGGTNTSVAFSRLGLKTAYLGKLGNDNPAKVVLDALKAEKVDTSLVVIEKEARKNTKTSKIQKNSKKTGYSTIIDAEGEDRTIFAFKGANDDLLFNELNLKKIKQTRWIYLGSMMGSSFNTAEKIAEFARKNCIPLAFNTSTYLAKKGLSYLKNILRCTTLFVLNKEEAELLTGKKDVNLQLKMLHKIDIKYIAITDGSNPAHACDGEKIYTIYPRKVKIKETTGAGDAFAATFVAGILKTNNTKQALELALANSESVITHYGAKNLLLHWHTLTEHVRKNPYRIEERRL